MGVVEILLLGVLISLWVTAIATCFMKGHWIYGLLGVPVFVIAFIGALMPAKPGSYWNRRAPSAP